MTAELTAAFREAASEDFTGRVGSPSPLYERLSLEIAGDPELLKLAGHARDEQPAPLLLFAAVQDLLTEQPKTPLADYYPSVGGETQPVDSGAYPAFKQFCQANRGAIQDTLETRRVQTNTVRRSACLLPAFEYVSRAADRAPFGLVEIGASAGLNLLWDQYSYSYTDPEGRSKTAGITESPVEIECELRGEIDPPIPSTLPPVGSRRGIDLHPLDVTDAADRQWLDALIWPEHETRRETLTNAVGIARAEPPTIHEGDAIELLESVIESVPDDQPVCLYNSYVLYQLSDSQRSALYDLVADLGADRDIYWLSCEWAMEIATPTITLYRYEDGVHSADLLGRFHGHGAWLDWLQQDQ